MLRGLAAHKGAPGLDAAFGDAGHDCCDLFGYDLAGGNVVGHEKGLGPDHDKVVDDHGYQVDADRVVLVELLGDHQFGTDAVGCAGKHRLRVAAEVELEKTGEAAEPSEHLRPIR